jgi:transcriptional regulator of acetoin/glycerol metabolism
VLALTALPAETQLFLAESLAERRAPGSAAALDVALVVSLASSQGGVPSLVASGALQPALAEWLGEHAVALPPWSARPEDQRALLLDRIGRLGLRLRGRPMGLDPRALARLVEHEWPGNDVEVNDVLTRAALVTAGDVVTLAELDQIGFVPTPARRSSRSPGSYAVGS